MKPNKHDRRDNILTRIKTSDNDPDRLLAFIDFYQHEIEYGEREDMIRDYKERIKIIKEYLNNVL